MQACKLAPVIGHLGSKILVLEKQMPRLTRTVDWALQL